MNNPVRVRLQNHSKYSKDIVWKNALDLEHVTSLHSLTNAEFCLMGAYPESNDDYEVLIYRSTRKLFCLRLNSFGFRKVVAKYQLAQVEYVPLLRVTTALNSLLRDSKDPGFETDLIDEIVVELPWFLRPFAWVFRRSLARHARIQCAEDEPFRQRLNELKEKGISFPYRKFAVPTFEVMFAQFRETLSS